MANLDLIKSEQGPRLAFLEKAISLPEIVAAAFLEEEYQAEKWGADEEAGERRRAIQQELELMASYS